MLFFFANFLQSDGNITTWTPHKQQRGTWHVLFWGCLFSFLVCTPPPPSLPHLPRPFQIHFWVLGSGKFRNVSASLRVHKHILPPPSSFFFPFYFSFCAPVPAARSLSHWVIRWQTTFFCSAPSCHRLCTPLPPPPPSEHTHTTLFSYHDLLCKASLLYSQRITCITVFMTHYYLFAPLRPWN